MITRKKEEELSGVGNCPRSDGDVVHPGSLWLCSLPLEAGQPHQMAELQRDEAHCD